MIHKSENNYTHYKEDAYRKFYVRTTSYNTVNEMHENLAAGDTIIKYTKQTILIIEL